MDNIKADLKYGEGRGIIFLTENTEYQQAF
jgi:hypothetical protein